MREKCVLIVVLLLSFLAAGALTPIGATQQEVSATTDRLLAKHEKSGRAFIRSEIGDKTVYFHQRKLNDAVVEKDFILYQFDTKTGKLLDRKVHWRTDLPDRVVQVPGQAERGPMLPKQQVEAYVPGEIQFSRLMILSPESDVFPIQPTPTNPCWIVMSLQDGALVVSVIDAVTGGLHGYGVPPPQTTGFSMSGPIYFGPCSSTWASWYLNAEFWFEQMGYPTKAVEWPTEEQVQGNIASTQTAVFYELAHGGYLGFCSGCSDGQGCEETSVTEVAAWIADYPKMPFTFLGSCEGMCETDSGTLSHELRKGSDEGTSTVGYCGMAADYCWDCWVNSIGWQDSFFDSLSEGKTVQESYEKAVADYPVCSPPEGSCMRYEGDGNLTLVPTVYRAPWIEVPVDVKPRSCPNPLNVGSQGVVPVAILGDGNLDVHRIDPSSIRLEGVAPLRHNYEDVASPFEPYTGKDNLLDCSKQGPDGWVDLTLKFDTARIASALGNVEDRDVVVLELTGNLKESFGGSPMVGEDVVLVLGKKKK